VQKSDVERVAPRGGVSGGEIVGDRSGREALAVHPHAGAGDLEAFRCPHRELVDVRRQPEMLGDPTFGVVVAADEHDRDVECAKSRQLRREKEPRRVVPPASIEDVARQEQECSFLFEAEIDEVLEGASRRAAHRRKRCSLVANQSAHRAVDVEVGGVNELHAAGLAY
jgi:hypothetical protein